MVAYRKVDHTTDSDLVVSYLGLSPGKSKSSGSWTAYSMSSNFVFLLNICPNKRLEDFYFFMLKKNQEEKY